MAASSHPASTLTAIDVLRSGGNAVDAAIAAVAVQCVVEPHMTGIGGDCFVLYAPASGGVVALNGSGRAPAALTVERLVGSGVTAIGSTSAHAVTVPGAIAGWQLLLDAHGTRGLDELLRPAIRCAEEGFAVTPRVAFDWGRNQAALEASQGGRDYYLPGGKAPEEGRLMRFPALGRTLRRIAEGGARAFYEGEIADRMVAALQGFGGVHTAADFATASAELVDPIHAGYRDTVVYECPPNGQGIVVLEMLNILERFDLKALGQDTAARLHVLAEAAPPRVPRPRRCLVRHRPRRDADRPPARQRLRQRAGSADRPRARDGRHAPAAAGAHPDTVYLTVVDKDLNAVSFINSIYDGFGSGLVCPDTGVLFHSRGRAFRVDPDHPNVVAPGKRPMHTIIPGLAFKGGELWCSFGVMGGNYQPVGQAHLLTRLIDDGLDPQAALDAPRLMPYPGDLEVEAGIGRDGAARSRPARPSRGRHPLRRSAVGRPSSWIAGAAC